MSVLVCEIRLKQLCVHQVSANSQMLEEEASINRFWHIL